jgi:hypothetical protein
MADIRDKTDNQRLAFLLNPLPARHPKGGVEKNMALPDTLLRVSGYSLLSKVHKSRKEIMKKM